jgi:mandelate racemase
MTSVHNLTYNVFRRHPVDVAIKGVRARAVNVPLEYPIRTAVGTVATSPLVLIDLETNAGVHGRSYIFAYIPAALKPAEAAVRELGTFVIDRPLAPLELDVLIEQKLRLIGNTGLLRMAAAGIDMAAWDALAKERGLPLAVLLGGQLRPLRAYDSHSMDGRSLASQRAIRAAEAGFTAVKTKIGYDTLDEDLAVIRAIRAETAGKLRIMVDYNQSLNVPEAIRRGRILDDEGLEWIEEPTLQQDFSGHARIRTVLKTPIQMGENWLGFAEMSRALQENATTFAMADIMKIGGVTGWLRASALAHLHGVPLSSHIFQEFSAHLLAVSPTAHWLERLDIGGPILRHGLTFEAGAARIPDVPGVGLDWDEEAVAKYLA